MRLDSQAVADVVVLAVKSALQPVLERLAASDARAEALQAQVHALTEMRDRVVSLETKAARPEHVAVDLAPVLERLAVVETKVATPVLPLPPEAGVDDLRDRLVTLETRSAGPSLTDMAVVDLRERLGHIERRVTDDAFSKELGALRERVAVMEVKGQIPGPPGKDGVNGKDGADGLGFDDLDVEFDGDRTMALKFARGDVKKSFPVTFPYLKYQGLYQDGHVYVQGDTVTYGGHMWYCHGGDTITKPGESKAWQQCVQRGREGKAGQDLRGVPQVPVVSVGRRD